MSKIAIILGATGYTGGILLEKLIADASYEKIKLFSRSAVTNTSSKIEEYLIDVLKLEDYKSIFTADEVFCCIGTTASKTKNKEVYKSIDYGIPVTAAKLAKENKISTFVVMSSMGAAVSSTVFYSRTKGEMERDVVKKNIKNTVILRPSLIGGRRPEFRVGEKMGIGVMSIIGPILIGGLKKYRIIHPERIAACMKIVANNPQGRKILSSDKILTIAKLKE
jgi:uncharacterized protein YbjT (DUF2867 family)